MIELTVTRGLNPSETEKSAAGAEWGLEETVCRKKSKVRKQDPSLMTYGAADGFVHKWFSIAWKTADGPVRTGRKRSGVTVASRASSCGAANS